MIYEILYLILEIKAKARQKHAQQIKLIKPIKANKLFQAARRFCVSLEHLPT